MSTDRPIPIPWRSVKLFTTNGHMGHAFSENLLKVVLKHSVAVLGSQ